MLKVIKKYCTGVVSVVLLTCFSLTSLGYFIIVSEYCGYNEDSCCCIHYDNNVDNYATIEKKCCCEIKEMSAQPPIFDQRLIESGNKNILPALISHSDITFNDKDFLKFSSGKFSFNPPLKEKIHILNSNFRI